VVGIPLALGILFWLFMIARGGGTGALASLSPHQPQTFAYTIVPGDTIQNLAVAFGATPATLRSVNRLAPGVEPRDGQQLLIPRPAAGYRLDGEFPAGVRDLVAAAARRFHVDVSLALAVAWQESRGQEQAVSARHAMGIMQVEPVTGQQVASQLGVSIDLHNANDDVTAGVYWLGSLLRFYHGDVEQALAAYNEGQTNLARYGFLPDARQYMQDVLRFRIAFANG
jgi:soluble lytic murein transglycosylase-like protein